MSGFMLADYVDSNDIHQSTIKTYRFLEFVLKIELRRNDPSENCYEFESSIGAFWVFFLGLDNLGR